MKKIILTLLVFTVAFVVSSCSTDSGCGANCRGIGAGVSTIEIYLANGRTSVTNGFGDTLYVITRIDGVEVSGELISDIQWSHSANNSISGGGLLQKSGIANGVAFTVSDGGGPHVGEYVQVTVSWRGVSATAKIDVIYT